MNKEAALRKRLVELLRGKGAHVAFEEALGNFPEHLRGKGVSGIPYTAWQILEHLRIAQWDILEFSRNQKHVSPEWPDGYWPDGEAPSDDGAWDRSVSDFNRDQKEMQDLVSDPDTDLHARIPHGTGQDILREALLVADHNAYHLGQLVMLRKMLGAWEK
ncbi:MAG: DinB family protein [Bacteroidetes bacterium]|nr:DinB family protein [Bacteroidota bacterium]